MAHLEFALTVNLPVTIHLPMPATARLRLSGFGEPPKYVKSLHVGLYLGVLGYYFTYFWGLGRV